MDTESVKSYTSTEIVPYKPKPTYSVYSIHDMYNKYVERKHKDHDIYRTILYDIFKRIEERFNKGLYNLIYTVPVVVYGNTKYKISTCINYIMLKVSKAGYIILPYENNCLYIDWSIVKSMKKTKKVRFDKRAKILN